MSLSKVIEVARGELGNTEWPPGSNMQKYGEAYGLNGVPWCLQFLWWCFREAGERMAFFGGGKIASCGTFLKWYQEQGQTVPVSEVQPGDIVLLNFHGKQTPEHCGLVSWAGAVNLTTIEGNTSPGLDGIQDNGGCVALKRRYPSQIVAVCRPQYKEDEMIKDDLTDHWAERSCRKAEQKAIMKGYPDGTWRPDKEVTRAELAVILDRLGLLD